MKKGIMCAVLALVASCVLMAESYTVKAVQGTVQYEASPDTWKAVSVGQVITDATVIKTAVNSNLTLADSNGEALKVKPLQKGTVAKLATASSGKVKKGSSVVKTDVSNSSSSRKSVSTASSRASEAKEDVEWDE